MAYRKLRRPVRDDEIKLNVAAMLDMAFQLLAFFILTFRPAPMEGHLALRMPDAKSPGIVKEKIEPGDKLRDDKRAKDLEQLTVSLLSNPSGELGSIRVGENDLLKDGAQSQQQKVAQLHSFLQSQFSDPGKPFERLVLQVGSTMRYDTLMQIMDRCTQLRLADQKRLTKVTFVELPADSAAGDR